MSTSVTRLPDAPAVAADHEADRLQALRDLEVLDSPPDPVFEALAAAAGEICGTPIALISLIDSDRQWFKANVGLPGVEQTPRSVAFCDHAIRDAEMLEVNDARLDPRFAHNPLVEGDPNIRFYAGAPIALEGGQRIGTVCVIDRNVRQLDAAQRAALRHLAAVAAHSLIERRRRIASARELAASEERYRAIVEDQVELISIADFDGTLRFVNAAYARHHGLRADELIGRNLLEFVPEADRGVVRAHLAAVRDGGGTSDGVNRIASSDGRTRWVAWSNRCLHDASGRPIALQSVGRDITEQKLAEQALAKASAHLDAVVDNVPAMLGHWDGDGITQIANREFQAAVGVPMRDIVGHGLRELWLQVDPQSWPKMAAHVDAVLAGRRQEFEVAMLTVAGLRQLRASLVPHRPDPSQPQRVAGFYGLWYDVTGPKALELRLLESEQRYRSLFDHLNGGFALHELVVDADGTPVDYKFLAMNAAFGVITGFEPGKMLGRRVTEVLPGIASDPADWIGTFGRVVKSGQPAHFEQRSADLQRWFEVVAYRPAPGQFAVIAQDVTPRKQIEQRIELALAEKETLLKEVYHRVKNNLQMVQSLLALQRRSLADPAAQAALDDSVQRVRAMALVHEKLYQSGNLSAVVLDDYADDLLRQIGESASAPRRGIRLVGAVEKLETGLDNAIPFGLLVAELVTNALKHAFGGRDGGTVRVTLAREATGGARLTVADDGVGLPEGFDLARPASMGLQLAASLARQLGGELEAANRSGAAFSAMLARL